MSFALLHDFFNKEEGQFCDNLGECFVTVLRGGLLDTLGGVGYDVTVNKIANLYTQSILWKTANYY